jgi:hypothetical protein
MVNANHQGNGGHYKPGDIVMYNGEQYTVLEFVGEKLEIDVVDNELVVNSNDKYKMQSNDGNVIEIVDRGDVMKIGNNNNNNQNNRMNVNILYQNGGRTSNRKRTSRKKYKKSLRSKRRGSRRH